MFPNRYKGCSFTCYLREEVSRYVVFVGECARVFVDIRWCRICQKRIKIEARFQNTTNRKWHVANRMVMWSMTSRDPGELFPLFLFSMHPLPLPYPAPLFIPLFSSRPLNSPSVHGGLLCPCDRFSARRAIKVGSCNTCCHYIVTKFVTYITTQTDLL